MQVAALLQARTGSRRLPGKVLAPILGQPMLLQQVARVRRATRIDRLIVITSTDPSDDLLAACCGGAGVECFRGSLDDVLDRFYQAARLSGANHLVRLTGDCPLADPAVIDAVIERHLSEGADYTSNALQPTYPDGLDVEVVRMATLEAAWRGATLKWHREHVMPFIHSQPDRFKLCSVTRTPDLSNLRWTVDEPADLEFVTEVYSELSPGNPAFGMNEVLALLENRPALQLLNAKFERNEGLAVSVRKEESEK